MKNLGALLYVALLVLGIAIVYSAYASDYEEGKQYQRLPDNVADNKLVKAYKQKAGQKIQVLEFFSYGCEWCFKLDPFVEKWRQNKPDDVEFERIPVEFHPTWAPLTKAYYAQVKLNAIDKIHSPLFAAFQNEGIASNSQEALRQYFETHGISAKAFDKAFTSTEVADKQAWAKSIAQAYRITSVPAMVVQGPKGSFITAVRYAGSEDEVIKVVDELIKLQKQPAKSKQ